MTPAKIIDTICKGGGSLWLDRGRLRYRGPTEVIAPLLPSMKSSKPALLRLLAARELISKGAKTRVLGVISLSVIQSDIDLETALSWLVDADLEDIAAGRLDTRKLRIYFQQHIDVYQHLQKFAPSTESVSQRWRKALLGVNLPNGGAND